MLAAFIPVTQASGSGSAPGRCAKSVHPATEIVYDAGRMEATFTFDTKRCMGDHASYLVQARVYGPSAVDATAKLCKAGRACRISVRVPHDPVEIQGEYMFHAYYSGQDDQSVRNYMGPYICTSLIVHQECDEP